MLAVKMNHAECVKLLYDLSDPCFDLGERDNNYKRTGEEVARIISKAFTSLNL